MSAMPEFQHALLRLKERLGVASDKAVAELLGMGEKALNARKRRGAFPVDKLKALAADRPELGLDVGYVMTGITEALDGPTPSLDLHRQVRASFVAQGTSLHRWCEDNDILPSNARDALIGCWNGPKGKALRSKLVKASGLKAVA